MEDPQGLGAHGVPIRPIKAAPKTKRSGWRRGLVLMVVLGFALAALMASPTLYRNPPQVEFHDKGVWVRIYYGRTQLERGSFFGVPVETSHGAPDSLVLYANAVEREAHEGRVLRRFSLTGPQGRHADFTCAQGGGAFCAAVDLRAELCAIQADHIGLTFQLPDGGMVEEVFPLQFRTDTVLVTWLGKRLEGVPLYRHARPLAIAEICALSPGRLTADGRRPLEVSPPANGP